MSQIINRNSDNYEYHTHFHSVYIFGAVDGSQPHALKIEPKRFNVTKLNLGGTE